MPERPTTLPTALRRTQPIESPLFSDVEAREEAIVSSGRIWTLKKRLDRIADSDYCLVIEILYHDEDD